MDDVPIEVISWRLASSSPAVNIRLDAAHAGAGGDLASARRGVRQVLFEGYGWRPCTVYDRYKLPVGASFEGPALVEERESTW